MKFILRFLLYFAVTAAGLAERQSLQVLQDGGFRYPYFLIQSGLFSGTTEVVISVDSNGVLKDYIITGYNEDRFATVTEDYLKRLKFKPASIDGVAIPVVSKISFEFNATGVVVQGVGFDVTNAYLNRNLGRYMKNLSYTLKEIDRIPTPTTIVTPQAVGVVGSVEIRFFIDEEGKVRLPYVESSDNPELGANAMDAIRQWKFDPPTHQGRPVLVFASQEFKFKMKKDKE